MQVDCPQLYIFFQQILVNSCVIGVPLTMATSESNEALPIVWPSTSQTFNSNPQAESSSARCCVFQGKKQRQLKDTKVTKAQKHTERSQVRSSMNFRFSATSSVPDATLAATNTVRQTIPGKRVHTRNSVSYLLFLRRRIRHILFKVNSFRDALDKSIRRMHHRIDVCTDKLNSRVNTMRFNRVRGDDLVKVLQQLNDKKDSLKKYLKLMKDLLDTERSVYNRGIKRDADQLDSMSAPFAQELHRQRELLDFEVASYTQGCAEKMECLTSKYSSCFIIFGNEFRDCGLFENVTA